MRASPRSSRSGSRASAADGDVVDAGLSEPSERLLALIRELCRRESVNPALRYVVNTHWHSEHTGGNETLAAAGALVVAHENVLRLLSQDQVMAHLRDRLVPAAPERARPRLTFKNRINLSWNQDLIYVVHAPNTHSNGDVIVPFRDADVIHMGDILNDNYPFIDVDFDGHIGRIIRAVDEPWRTLGGVRCSFRGMARWPIVRICCATGTCLRRYGTTCRL